MQRAENPAADMQAVYEMESFSLRELMQCQNSTEQSDAQLVYRKLGNWFLVLENTPEWPYFKKRVELRLRVGPESNIDLCSYKKGEIWTHRQTHRETTM